ncbi:hypothetical protein Droror1_Dr00013164 [Drosera rotundifolia]
MFCSSMPSALRISIDSDQLCFSHLCPEKALRLLMMSLSWSIINIRCTSRRDAIPTSSSILSTLSSSKINLLNALLKLSLKCFCNSFHAYCRCFTIEFIKLQVAVEVTKCHLLLL